MALLPSSFNSTDHDDMGIFKAMVKGDYPFKLISSEEKLTKAGKAAKEQGVEDYAACGSMIVLGFECLTGEYKGRKLNVYLNVQNKNNTTVEMAFQELATLQRALDREGARTTEEMHNIPVILELKVNPPKGNFGESNSVVTYKPYVDNDADVAGVDGDALWDDRQEPDETELGTNSDSSVDALVDEDADYDYSEPDGVAPESESMDLYGF